jgi:UDP-N-acetylmuramate: L-alanyl-gamma-D-glutamyl-meso-diaminopimelate ligase
VTNLSIEGHQVALKVFGDHNLLNIQAAYLVCKELGVPATGFLDAIANFTGASKRLEVLAQNNQAIIFRDFAHAPSKVKATIEAVKQQYPDRRLIAVLELHTYSSLNMAFMPHYKGALDPADEACVFYSHHAMEIKKMPELPENLVEEGFAKPGLKVFTDRDSLMNWLDERKYSGSCLLLMSSGSYDGLDLSVLTEKITATDHHYPNSSMIFRMYLC